MTTLLNLTSFVQRILQDNAFDDDITTYLNQAQLEIAGGMQSALGDWLTPELPELLTIGTVTTVTDVAYVNMPTNFQRRLQFVASASGTEISIEENFIEFTATYPLLDKAGIITSVVEKGGKFYYQGIPPVAEDVTLHYYKKPTDMSDNTDKPDGIPSHLQKELLVNHTCWKIFELIEDGLEGPGVNTQRYMDLFYRALKVLELTIPYQRRGFNLLNDN